MTIGSKNNQIMFHLHSSLYLHLYCKDKKVIPHMIDKDLYLSQIEVGCDMTLNRKQTLRHINNIIMGAITSIQELHLRRPLILPTCFYQTVQTAAITVCRTHVQSRLAFHAVLQQHLISTNLLTHCHTLQSNNKFSNG